MLYFADVDDEVKVVPPPRRPSRTRKRNFVEVDTKTAPGKAKKQKKATRAAEGKTKVIEASSSDDSEDSNYKLSTDSAVSSESGSDVRAQAWYAFNLDYNFLLKP